MEDSFEVISNAKPLGKLVFAALSRNPATHSVYLLYARLLFEADTRSTLTNQELADSLGFGLAQVKRMLRLLRRLGLVSISTDRRDRVIVVTTHYLIDDNRLPRVLELIASGRILLDLKEGTVTDSKTGRQFDAEQLRLRLLGDPRLLEELRLLEEPGLLQEPPAAVPAADLSSMAATTSEASCRNDSGVATTLQNVSERVVINRSRNTKRPSTSTRINKLLTESFYSKDKMPISKGYHLPLSGFDPKKDPYQPDVEAVQEYANAVLKTEHSVYAPDGGVGERYGVILRALHHFGYTIDQLKKAIDTVPNHHYWSKSGVKDLAKLFRKDSNIDQLVNYVPPTNLKADTRHLEMRAIYGPKTVTTEEF